VLQVGPGIGVEVDCVIDSGAVGVSKPDPRIFQLALDAIGVAATDAWYLGDMPGIDVVGARAAGLWPIVMDPFGFQADADYHRVTALAEVAEMVSAS
jgi:putative hydrolase of the HAD superfamily